MPIPFRPSPPSAPCFDAARDAWILSRYSDVSATLQETSLCQSNADNEPTNSDGALHSRLVAEVQTDIGRMSADVWRAQIEETLFNLLQRAKRRRSADLVRDVIHPWATTMLVILNGGRAFHSRRLVEISERLFYGPAMDDAAPQNDKRELARQNKALEGELDRMLESRQLLPCRSMFFGLTQTLPSFLAKAWLALLRHPDQIAKLVADPKLISNATEELLRYAGLVHTLYRRSTRDFSIGDLHVKNQQMVILELDSANFDPDRFEQSNRMDITRRAAGHLGLGAGLNGCVGSFLVRMACSVATPIFLAARPLLITGEEVVWTGDRTVLWPLSIPVSFSGTPVIGTYAAEQVSGRAWRYR